MNVLEISELVGEIAKKLDTVESLSAFGCVSKLFRNVIRHGFKNYRKHRKIVITRVSAAVNEMIQTIHQVYTRQPGQYDSDRKNCFYRSDLCVALIMHSGFKGGIRHGSYDINNLILKYRDAMVKELLNDIIKQTSFFSNSTYHNPSLLVLSFNGHRFDSENDLLGNHKSLSMLRDFYCCGKWLKLQWEKIENCISSFSRSDTACPHAFSSTF